LESREHSDTLVGETHEVKVIFCKYCKLPEVYWVRGFFINWFGKKTEYIMPEQVECRNCLRDIDFK